MTEDYDERNGLFYCIKAVKRFEKEMKRDKIVQEVVEKTKNWCRWSECQMLRCEPL